MTKLPSKPLSPKKDSQFFNQLASAIDLLRGQKEIKDFLLDILSHTERKMISKRLQIAVMLLQGYHYSDIREKVEVSDITIAKISNWLTSGANSLEKMAIKIGEKDSIVRKTTRPKRRYLAGDLFTPAIDEGLSLAARKIAEK